MPQLLWRIAGAPADPHLDAWQQGLTLHLLFQPITLVIAHRNGQSRHYLALHGCPDCRPDGCERVCHRMLFEQLVRTTLPGVTLIPTPRLVPRASESLRVAATPVQGDARLLDAAFLEQWPEGRLAITVSRLQARPQPVRVGALLAVGGEGPRPASALQSYGWRGSRLAALLCRKEFERPLPAAAPVGSRAGEAILHALRDPSTFAGNHPVGSFSTESVGAAEPCLVSVEPQS